MKVPSAKAKRGKAVAREVKVAGQGKKGQARIVSSKARTHS